MPLLIAAALLFQVQDLRKIEKPCPFVVVTLAGERVGSLDRPKHDGKPVKFRLCTNQTLTALPTGDVDWPATEKANTPEAVAAAAPVAPTFPTRPTLRRFAKETTLRD